MTVYTVFTKNEKTLFKTTICSKSSLFLVLITFLTLFFPLLIAYRSQGFWIKFLTYREQPLVHFKQEYFLHVDTTKESNPIVCTTIQQPSQSLQILDQCTLIRFNEKDDNGDGKLDSLQMDIEIQLNEEIHVQSVFLVLIFDYILQNQCLLEMEGLATLQAGAPYQSRELHILGDLIFAQRNVLNCRGRDLRYNQSSFSDPYVNIEKLVNLHMLQNVSTKLDVKNKHWTRGSDTTFNIHIELSYPEVTVTYKPGFWPIMKWAWVQYMPILTIFIYLSKWIKGYVFQNHLLPTMAERPWKKFLQK